VADTLVVNEIYLSLQGESTFAGLPCVFVRLTACNLRCSYCDTAYAFTEGGRVPLEAVLAEVHRLAAPFGSAKLETLTTGSKIRDPESGIRNPRLPLVELTGGEPLLQPAALPLMRALCDAGFTVLLETSGALDIAPVDPRVRRIMDLKCPSSGEAERNRWENLAHLRSTDEVKFVIGTAEDYAWAKEVLHRHKLAAICPVLFSWAAPLAPHQRDPSLKPVPAGHTPLSRRELAERILADALPVRFQAQLHKVIWPPDQRGV
jgi:7-carboxy-7-deazaguanine synthase